MSLKNYLKFSTNNTYKDVSDHVDKYSSVLRELNSTNVNHNNNCKFIAFKVRYPNNPENSTRYMEVFNSENIDLKRFYFDVNPIVSRIGFQNDENVNQFLCDMPQTHTNYQYWISQSKNLVVYDTSYLYSKIVCSLTVDILPELNFIQNYLELYNIATSVILDPFFALLMGFQAFIISGISLYNQSSHLKLIVSAIKNLNSRASFFMYKSYKMYCGFILNSVVSFGLGFAFSKYIVTVDNQYKFNGFVGENIESFNAFGMKVIYNVFNTISKFRNTAWKAILDPFFELTSSYIDKILKKIDQI